MSLRLKINLLVSALTLLFLTAVMGLQLRNMQESVREEVVAANRVAAQLLKRTAWLYAAQGTLAMRAFLEGVGRVRSNEISLLDAQGNELYHSPPSPYKAGRDAPDWFERLVSPPPDEQFIGFPDGKLVVRANASRAIIDAWDSATTMVSSALVLLAVVNALVFWLVGRAVRPFARIVGALGEVEAGRFGVQLPRLPGIEAAAIGAAFNRMVGQLEDHIETERRAVRAEMQLSDSRELARWVERHVEQERRMIARELHDELGQSVTAMRSMATSIAQRSKDKDAPTEQAARLIADECSRLYDAMHGIIPRLAPLVLDRFGLGEALADLAERTRRAQRGVQLDLQVALDDEPLSPETALALYRAAQEGVTNALRHGQASHITLDLRREPDGLRLQVTDNGNGPPPAPAAGRPAPDTGAPGHYGLRWLAERVEGLGGRFALLPAPGRGARLEVCLPMETR
ncbi:ATP-binding protein [uncultured Aquincola sp.]|uniref:ATP-binding protein n=1 Tax=uncultured Aquincola sp. TaxID=886556 RepID=UPI0032B2CACB